MAKRTVRLWLRNDKPNTGRTQKVAAGTVPVHLILSIKGEREFFNTEVSIYPEQWDDQTLTPHNLPTIKALPTEYAKKYGLKQFDLPEITKHAKKQNTEIAELVNRIDFFIQGLERDGHVFAKGSCKIVMDSLKNEKRPEPEIDDSANRELLAFMKDWIAKNETMRKKGSMQVYRTVTKRLADYEIKRKTKLTFETINHAFFEDFNAYLIETTNLNSITIAKQLSTLKTFLHKAMKQEIPVNLNFKSYKVEREDDLEVIALTEKEFNTLWDLDLSNNKRFDAIRDVFIFSCVSGMRFSDLEQLNWNQIKAKNIKQTVTKTKMKLDIPLNNYSRTILEKYKDLPRPLPIISNQKSNDALHDLCEYAELDDPIEIVRTVGAETVKTVFPKHELITMHSGRKTFATLSLKKGMSIQNVMKVGGWKDFKSFARYVNVSNEDAQEAMAGAWDK